MAAASEKQVEALTRQMEQMQQMMAALQQGANPPPTGEVYGYDKRHGREAAWDVVQRHEMVGVFKWPAMRGSKAMHHLPDCVKEYFTSATDAAEADPKARRATTTKTNCR